MSLLRTVVCLSLVFLRTPVRAQAPDPLDIGVEERVEVELVLIDVTVTDRDGAPVTDLAAGDFSLLVEGDEVPIETFDRWCGGDDRGTGGAADDGAPPGAESAAGRGVLVLAFDYRHMGGTRIADALDAARGAIATGRIAADDWMVVSIGRVLRIEAPLTAERSAIGGALERMKGEPRLYAGHHRGPTERRFFDRMLSLLDVLEGIEGRKAVVLFSGPFVPDGWERDPEYARLAARAGATRTAIYPVDVGGLRTRHDAGSGLLGGPPALSRLALETGGRSTSDTNDLAMGLVRAGKDLSCTYTLGFRDPRPRFDRDRQLVVVVPSRAGVRAWAPSSYVVRSGVERSRSLADTASVVPERFLDGSLEVSLRAVRPRSPWSWDAVLVVRGNARSHEETDGRARTTELRGFVRNPEGTLLRSMRRDVPVGRWTGPDAEPFGLRPGRYRASAVLAGLDGEPPVAASAEATIPEIPGDGGILVGAFLGRTVAVGEVAAQAERPLFPAGFEPVWTEAAKIADALAVLTRVCRVGRHDSGDAGPVERVLTRGDATVLPAPAPASARLEGDGSVRCGDLVDALPRDRLTPGGYRWTATWTDGSATHTTSVEFTIEEERTP